MKFHRDELLPFLAEQSKIFDIVRVVDPALATWHTINRDGTTTEEPYHCYSTWNKGGRCENCISSRVLATKDRQTKFEFIGEEVYFVLASYAEIEGKPHAIELVIKLQDEVLFNAYGKNDFIQAIKTKNDELYLDSLTGARSRRFYDENIKDLGKYQGIAVLDIDNLKDTNDTYGHRAGDELLVKTVSIINSYIRSSDSVIRIGGDEFLLLFLGISKAAFENKLEDIRFAVSQLHLEEFPEARTTISIGAVFSSSVSDNSIQLADKAMYAAKETKNSIVIESVA